MPQASRAAVLILALAAACDGPSRPSGEPTPAPSPSPPPMGCGAPPGVFNENCFREEPTFYGELDQAIEFLIATEPELFDLGHSRGCGRCFLVLDPERFTARLVARLEEMRLCAFYDGEELGVKSSNAFNDQYDVLTFEMFLRRENGSYRTTCRPAWF